MRLIDADDFKKFMQALCKAGSPYESFIELLDKQTTAYDIDKVVEEFEKIRAKETCNKEKCDKKEICRICVVDDAIEIVKQGGVSDDVCEWNLDGVYIFSPHSKMFSCVIDDKHRYTYCPVCGKKIKVVE